MRAAGLRLRPLLAAALLVWVLRWAALEVAGRVASRAPRRSHDPDPARRPGWMPGPLD